MDQLPEKQSSVLELSGHLRFFNEFEKQLFHNSTEIFIVQAKLVFSFIYFNLWI